MACYPPRFDRSIDLDEHVALLPPSASAKGLFLKDAVQRAERASPGVDVFRQAGVPHRRIQSFFDYPYGELMRLLVASGQIIWPGQPTGETLRRLGQGAYETLLNAQFGRVLFAAFGNDFSRIAAVGVRAWKVSVNFGSVAYREIEPGQGIYHFRDMPAFLETYQIGVIEGAMKICGVEGSVEIELHSLSDADILMRWR